MTVRRFLILAMALCFPSLALADKVQPAQP
jgi:hypothetical protein